MPTNRKQIREMVTKALKKKLKEMESFGDDGIENWNDKKVPAGNRDSKPKPGMKTGELDEGGLAARKENEPADKAGKRRMHADRIHEDDIDEEMELDVGGADDLADIDTVDIDDAIDGDLATEGGLAARKENEPADKAGKRRMHADRIHEDDAERDIEAAAEEARTQEQKKGRASNEPSAAERAREDAAKVDNQNQRAAATKRNENLSDKDWYNKSLYENLVRKWSK